MFEALRRRLKTTNNKSNRQSIGYHVDRDDTPDLAPPRFIEVEKGKICLGPPPPLPPKEFLESPKKDKEVLEARIAELEEALARLYDKFNQTQCGSPTMERDLQKQLDYMGRQLKTKDRKTWQVCRDHKTLQNRFQSQEACLQHLTSENKHLHQRILQYEHCLDDVMRKVVDAIVAEDNLREEVSMLKGRVRDLEKQNAALSAGSSPSSSGGEGTNGSVSHNPPVVGKARGDEGYCTMSSGSGVIEQHPMLDGHLENLAEEELEHQHQERPSDRTLLDDAMIDESTSANMEDWSLSQEELGGALAYDESNSIEHDWIWNTDNLLPSTVDSQSESITQLLQDTIEYSDDEEVTCKSFTRDFYKLVNIKSESTRSLQSPADDTTATTSTMTSDDEAESERPQSDSEDSDDDDGSTRIQYTRSPTPSEAGLALVSSCSSSDSNASEIKTDGGEILVPINVLKNTTSPIKSLANQTALNAVWRQSTGWRRVRPTNSQQPSSSTFCSPSLIPKRKETKIPTAIGVRRPNIS